MAAGQGEMTHSPLVLAAQGHPVGPARETQAEIKWQPGHHEQPESRSGWAADTYPRARGARGAWQTYTALGTGQTL